jgi:hypothetical protein
MARNRTGTRNGKTPAAAGNPAKPQDRSLSAAEPAMATAAAPAEAPAETVAGPSPAETVTVHVEVVCGGITKVQVPVAIGGLYKGLDLAGPARAFDRRLDYWLTRALDLGMIGAELGQVFITPLEAQRRLGRVNADSLLIVGAGEPGHLSRDDLRFIFANATVVVKGMGHKHFSTELLGSRRQELPIDRALLGLLEGVLDGYAHLRAMGDATDPSKDYLRRLAAEDLYIYVVEKDSDKVDTIKETLELIRKNRCVAKLQLEACRGADVEQDEPEPQARPVDTDPDLPMTLLRVSCGAPARSGKRADTNRRILQYSALAERSAITVREHEVSSYFVRHLPKRLTAPCSADEQEQFGVFFTNYLVHDDFRGLLEDCRQLTLVVDDTTAALPWEMAAFRKHSYSECDYFGTELRLARRFRTLLSAPPASPPPLNRTLNVLIIADPASGRYALPGAQLEGRTVLDALAEAQAAWQGAYTIKATVRLGASAEQDEQKKAMLDGVLEKLRSQYAQHGLVESVAACDPLELAKLIVNQSFDVIHYAGHGVFDLDGGRAGWVFDEDCVLSAQEIFRVRQVPRLVFANACFSAVTNEHEHQRRQAVGLAQAFFARGIQNYIGTGWEVDDCLAAEMARLFYRRALGLGLPGEGITLIGRSPPAVLGNALADAREVIRKRGRAAAFDGPDPSKKRATWGAYQHYGQANDKLLALPNVPTDAQQATH